MRECFRTAAVAAAFFLTGGCALVYEILWTRYLSLLIGTNSLSQVIVLMVFMGGLALGAILTGRYVDRHPDRGLLLFGLLETGIGLYALLFPYLHKTFARLFHALGSDMASDSAGLTVLKISLSFSLIIVPSIAMGGTLPAVTRYLTKKFGGLRGSISLLYGINSMGAVIGIMTGGFFLVYRYGLTASMQYTGTFNLLLGLTVLTFATFAAVKKTDMAESAPDTYCEPEKNADCHIYGPGEVRAAFITAGLSGFAAMALQIAWIRYFLMFLGVTHSSFTIVVAAFVFGIGLGALLVRSNIFGRMYLPKVLLALLVLTVSALCLELFLYGRLPFEVGRILGIFAQTPFAWPFYNGTKFGILFLLMVPITLAGGMILPVCVRICEQSAKHMGRDVARVYAVNTVSSLLGILVAGQLFFRIFNLPRTFQVTLLLYLGIALFLILALAKTGRKRILFFLGSLLAVHLVFWKPWTPEQLFVNRVNFSHDTPLSYSDFQRYNENRSVVRDIHGPEAHVTVLDNTAAGENYRTLFINGKPDAGTSTDMTVQIMAGHLPILLHPSPENVFVLGLGSGITSGEILKFRDIKEVITAELAPEVFEASKAFADYNNRFWEHPRHRMVLDDGLNYLRRANEQFDVITLEPTNIWQAGIAGLFSEDFFQLVRSRLKPGGVAVQWLHTYMIDDRAVDIVLKTFSRVFPKASIFMPDRTNILLVGYDEQWRFDPRNLALRFQQPEILESQKIIGNMNGAMLLLREIVDRQNFHEYTRVLAAPINTLDFPTLEQAAEYGLFMQKSSTLPEKLDARTNPDGDGLLIHAFTSQVGFDPEQLNMVIDSALGRDNPRLRESLIFRILETSWPEDQSNPPLSALSRMYDAQLREIITHPDYRKPAALMTANEAYNTFGAELLIWYKAASQIWKPKSRRLHDLYERISREVDRETAGKVARDAGFSLAIGGSCSIAADFFRIAEAKGSLAPETLNSEETALVFHCEVRGGEPKRAVYWWEAIQEKGLPLTQAIQADKANLDIRLGDGESPAPLSEAATKLK